MSRTAPARGPISRTTPALICALALLALATAGASAAPTQQATRIYLPVVRQLTAPPTAVRFGTGQAGGALSGAGVAFDAGLTALFYEVTVEGGAGLPFRLEWSVDGRRLPELDRAAAMPPGGGPFISAIALSTGAPLPPGAYTLRVFVGGPLAAEGQATIR